MLYVNNIRNYYNIIRWITSNESNGNPEPEPEPEAPIEIASNQ
ncbi:MAG: hypothetical protein RLN69_02610 [Woeseiaceae bacterium]